MGSRRGRLNWSNLDVRISDSVIEQQHRFTVPNLPSPSSTITDDNIEKDDKINIISTSTKQSWVPKSDVGEVLAEQFIGNFMLTDAEEIALNEKYSKKNSTNKQKQNKQIQNSSVLASSYTSPQSRISNRLLPIRDEVLSPRISNLYVGQHLLNVFVCHVESYSQVYIMFGDDYNRATKLFQDMNNCTELLQSLNAIYEPQEQDLVALNHEKKWFRGRCLQSTDTNVSVLCLDSGVIISCVKTDVRRLPDIFRMSSPCCIECSLSGLPANITMDSIDDTVHSKCIELLYKDHYEAIVTKLESSNHPTIVLYYGDENINDRLLALHQLF